MVSHCGSVFWTDPVGSPDNFAWSGGRHFRVPVTDVTQDVQLQVFTVNKSKCVGQVWTRSSALRKKRSTLWNTQY